ncbi:hypothetical protein BJV85_003793 [Clostridium acetobutylicum]|uniref:Uncharacterized protein n=1 Tax=Clostridium acetobutylicum (strain ATCC 824 / DSM 792 / JCM 1419 / IAM 19013 / LMG 5710 / NBRC 13948 / NRRL B-527 / VKM B-1787 / 2291 / W) TaxID=272562 RepID=Q97TH1_CLOAB|nr:MULTISPECIES: hypothetical protein [Clostridium]AAK76875.1 Hypothetical protein CA_P0130 [Clostridium acetobutylicum ATCC 824]ADZ22912.1 Conserved hypothetical protein [Clostridium acetobutylicum EA 2018]AEI34871.1 hypothetical protein SMB_P128 [Clostridium acetobutylicum DSM 1731]AWV82417.1 hypothetical protein DK921_20210 [Clostridium acetobutylicum]MBC2395739.1 hypothetical protein [Clostridium acetobutylicum]
MEYAISKNVSSLYNLANEDFLEDIYSTNWTSNPVKQSIDIGPFKIEVSFYIDPQTILNSYFQLRVSVQIPFVGSVDIINGRIDKNNTRLEASIDQIVGASIIFDINALKLYAHLVAFGYTYDIILWSSSSNSNGQDVEQD